MPHSSTASSSRPADTAKDDTSPAEPAPRSEAASGRSVIATPAVEDLRILDEHGHADRDLDPQLSEPDLRRIHRAMVLTRAFDVRMLRMQRQGKMGTFAPGYGQEATQIGQVFPLTERDWFSPSYRSFGAQIWRGWPMDHLMLLWDGYFEGFAPPPGVNDLPFSIVIGSHVLPAVGVAMGMQRKGDDSVMLTNFGDGALSQGAIAEAFNFAAVSKAPVVFICENNGYAISMPVGEQCATPVLAQRGVGFGLPSIRVDGNDVLAVTVACREAVERARHGGGPTLVETVTYRMGVHTTADDPKVYREDEEVEAWKSRCPIVRFERYLIDRGVLSEDDIPQIAEACEQEVQIARRRFDDRRERRPREVFDFVYEELPADLREQQAEYLAKLDRKRID